MNDLERRIAELSPQKRELLLQRLQTTKKVSKTQSAMVKQPRLNHVFPLSFAQQRLWFLDQLVPNNSFYNLPTTVQLTGTLNCEALERSLREVIRRHEALRTTFGKVDNQPVQIIHENDAFTLERMDLGCFPEAERHHQAARIMNDEANRPFDLATGPVLRATLLKVHETDHILVLMMHHIVSDGWSLSVMVKEIGALYAAFSAGQPSPLPELQLQYPDFAVWQREWLQGEVLDTQLEYWKRQLANLPVLEMPTDRPRPLVQSFRGATQPLQISALLLDHLKELCLKEGITLFVGLLAVFKTWLQHYSRQTEIVVGTPIANRNRLETEGMIGFFANTLVLRTDLSGNPTFRQLLKRVNEVALSAYSHQDLPFEKLVEELRPERDLSRTPLFQVMLELFNGTGSSDAKETGDLTIGPLETESEIAKFDLTLFVVETKEGLLGTLEYNTDLYDASTVNRMIGHFQTMLEGAVRQPDTKLSDLPWLTPNERGQLLVDWNLTDVEGPPARCLHRMFEAQVERTPDAVALVFQGTELTYGEVNRRANQLAHFLGRWGVGPEVLVGICVERSLEMVIGFLAVVKAGGALVALDTAYPKDRLSLMVEAAGVPVLLTQEKLLDRLPNHSARIFCLDTGWETLQGESEANPERPVTEDNLLYAIFTSGSTGLPKGIGISHRAFGNLLSWQFQHPGLARSARTVQYSTFGFCVSFQEIFTTLCGGEALVILPEEIRRDIGGLAQFLKENAVERLHLPFAALKHLAESSADADSLPTSLRDIITAGEQLQVTPSVRRLFERLEGCALHNQYGASETHVVSALTLMPPHEPWPTIPSVGRPIANTRIYLLDQTMQPVPIGVPGELYVGGICLARGYLNDAALTAEKFVPDPFGEAPGGRLYKTGDLARFLPDGQIEYFGRADNQVKIRGFRIELGDIETTLVKHPLVRDAAVLAATNPQGVRYLVAYVVWHQDQPNDVNELRGFLKETLPDFMVPSIFVPLEKLPINANGKLDQLMLPTPELSRPDLTENFVPPSTTEERQLAAIWSQVLGIGQVGIHDNFFDLGGHSLLATQVFSRLRETFQVQLPLRVLFEHPTIAGLLESVTLEQMKNKAVTRPVLRARSRDSFRREIPSEDGSGVKRSSQSMGGAL